MLVMFDHLYSIPVFWGSHGHGRLKGWLMGGFIGVDVFFVLSGFLISALLIREFLNTGGVSLKMFYIRRALRLFPALAFSCVLFAVPIALINWRQGLVDYAYALTYTAVIPKALEVLRWFPQPYFYPHTWSLSVEEIFYALYPLIFIGICRARLGFFSARVWIPFLAVPLLSLPLSLPLLKGGAYQSPIWHFGQIFMGVMASVVYANARWRKRLEEAAPFLLCGPGFLSRVVGVAGSALIAHAALLVILAVLATGHPSAPWLFLWGFPSVTLAATLLTRHLSLTSTPGRGLLGFFERPRVQALGVISYGVYVYHVPLYRLCEHAALNNSWRPRRIGEDFPFWLAFDVFLVISTLLLSSWSYGAVERRFLEMKARFGGASSR